MADIKVTTPKSQKYDTKIDIYTNDPKKNIKPFILRLIVIIKVHILLITRIKKQSIQILSAI